MFESEPKWNGAIFVFFFAAQNIRIRHRRATFLPPKKISFRRWTVVEMWLDCSFAFKCAKWIFTIFSLFRLTKAPCWLLHVVFLVVRRRLAVSKLLSMNRAANRREKEGNKFILFFKNKIIRINFVKVCSRWSVDFRCLHIFSLKEKQVKLDPAARNGWNWITVKLSDFQAIFSWNIQMICKLSLREMFWQGRDHPEIE